MVFSLILLIEIPKQVKIRTFKQTINTMLIFKERGKAMFLISIP